MTWKNRLIRKAVLNSPVVEANPVIWQGKLLVVETWRFTWGNATAPGPPSWVRIREEGTDRIICRCMEEYGLASALVWQDALYVFAESKLKGASQNEPYANTIDVTCSTDLMTWSIPHVAIPGDEDGRLYNQSVCHDGQRFVMAYETRVHVPFTIKFAVSDDLLHWRRLPEAIYGTDRYTACPAIRYVGDYYYMLYLERPTPAWWFETWLTRSRDLVHWEDAPHHPVIAPDPTNGIYPDCPEHAAERGCTANRKEINASDPDLVEWEGRTRVYFTGGCQHCSGNLQYAEFDGSMQAFFESYYE